MMGRENRAVAAFGNGENKRFGLPFGFKIVFQFASKMTELGPNNVVIGRVEILTPSQDVAGDLEFAWYGIRPQQGQFGRIFQDASKLRCSLEAFARSDTLDKLPTAIAVKKGLIHSARVGHLVFQFHV
ncbi:MAG: hypothetical protein ABR928_21245 [Terracidiphilus sp.]